MTRGNKKTYRQILKESDKIEKQIQGDFRMAPKWWRVAAR